MYSVYYWYTILGIVSRGKYTKYKLVMDTYRVINPANDPATLTTHRIL